MSFISSTRILTFVFFAIAGSAQSYQVIGRSQYASDRYQQLLSDNGFICSMSRKGNCWDNAVAESFFHTLKAELIHHEDFQTREEAQQAIFEYVEVFYNRQRKHSTNGCLAPFMYEQKLAKAA